MILYKHTRWIHQLAGNKNYYSNSEHKQVDMSGAMHPTSHRHPFQLRLEPAVLYVNIYMALAYAIPYTSACSVV